MVSMRPLHFSLRQTPHYSYKSPDQVILTTQHAMAAALRTIGSTNDLKLALSSCSKAVLFFWASWSAPCKHMQQVLEALAKQHGGIAYLQVEAEEVDDVTEQYGVTTVPFFVFLQDGKEMDRLEGADIPGLTEKVTQLAAAGAAAATKTAPPAAAPAAAPPPAAAPVDVVSRIKALLGGSPVVLFMKGSAASPYCGFSRKVVDALTASGVQQFKDVDILKDEELRQALKEYSNWPTYPQLYVDGELVGGCDIVLEMQQTGELQQLIKEKAPAALQPPKQQQQQQAAAPAPAPAGLTPQQKQQLEALVQRQPVMLFMKGSPEAPRCGFSRKVVDALNSTGISFGTFDILGDEFVRQGLKQLSSWPTYPQVYVQGELLGGCDIVLEMQQAGELKLNIEEMLHRMQNAD